MINEIYGISYDHQKFQYDNKGITIHSLITKTSNTFSWNYYIKEFKKLNGSTNRLSKKLGSATDIEGDPYVAKILSDIHGIDFSYDDNGLNITKKALGNNPTYGFDFDLFDDAGNCIIEFLKRKSPYVNNLTAHPSRYLENKQKFISLYKSSRILRGSLHLVNYSDNYNEPISVIEVLKYDVHNGYFIEDCGYRFKNRSHLLEWLKLMNSNVPEAKRFLKNLPKEYRGYNNFGINSPENPEETNRLIGLKYRVGGK